MWGRRWVCRCLVPEHLCGEEQIDPNLVFGMPMGGWRAPDGFFEEGHQLEPDIMVRDEPQVLSAGHDQQIEAAVKELIKK